MIFSKKTFFKISVLLAMSGAFVFAQEALVQNTESDKKTVNLTIYEAVDYALEHSHSLKTADIDLEIKERAGKNAWNVLLPTVQATGTLKRTTDISSNLQQTNMLMTLAHQPIIEETESMKWTGIASLSVDWNFSLAMIQQIRAAKAGYEAGKISYEQSLVETEVNVKKLFYGLLLQQENLNLQKTTLENSRRRMVQAEANFKNGMVPELSMLQAQVTYQNKSPEVAQMEREFRQQLDTFAFLLGLPVGTDIVLQGSIEPFYVDLHYDTLIERYGNNSLDLQSIDKNIEQLQRNLDALNLSTYTPFFNLSYGFKPMLTDFLDADKGGFPTGGDWTDSGSISFTIGWNLTNILPFSSNRQQAKDLQANLDKLKVSREMLLENQKMTVRKSVDTLIQAREQIQSMNRSITLAQRSYDMTVRAYRNGTTELLDVRDAEDQLNTAKLGLANQKFNYISALLDLETTLNTKLTGGEK
ncbi:TolC family protein [uncultured Treponema sp.]|uniref:TolC family protein n=1 Tax=uncultured Treponema sp. TaxID=162155 RepID=UPI0025D93C1F|nr:TolC family protein [uncultured Treponema sp.]